MFDFCFLTIPDEVSLYLFIFFIIVVGTSFKYEMKIILEKSKRFKNCDFSREGKISPSPDRKYIFNFFNYLKKNFFHIYLMVVCKITPRILKCSLFKFTFFVPKSVVWTPFLTPIPVISHLLLFTFKPEYFEKISNF